MSHLLASRTGAFTQLNQAGFSKTGLQPARLPLQHNAGSLLMRFQRFIPGKYQFQMRFKNAFGQ